MKNVFYDKEIFAANLQRQMERRGEKQTDVARLLGVSKSTVSAYCAAKQMPRMDKLEQLARHYGISCSALLESAPPAPERAPVVLSSAADRLYSALNDRGQEEFLRYGQYLASHEEYRAAVRDSVPRIKHYIVPAAAGYASPVEGEDYELTERTALTPLHADFSVDIQGDSMEPHIHDGETVYVRRGAALDEFDVGIFYVDGDVFCKQWCVDYTGTLHLLSANPRREDANIRIPRSANRSVVCFGKVLLPARPPKPVYY